MVLNIWDAMSLVAFGGLLGISAMQVALRGTVVVAWCSGVFATLCICLVLARAGLL